MDTPEASTSPAASEGEAGRPVWSGSHQASGTTTIARSSRSWTIVAVLASLMLAGGILLFRGWRPDGADASPAAAGAAVPASAEIEATYGVRILGVDVTAAGGMIQIRYQVLDPDKVDAVHDGDGSPVVVGPDGHLYADPGMAGHSHLGRIGGAGSTNTILLANAQGGVHRGDRVTVRVGDLELHGVPVG